MCQNSDHLGGLRRCFASPLRSLLRPQTPQTPRLISFTLQLCVQALLHSWTSAGEQICCHTTWQSPYCLDFPHCINRSSDSPVEGFLLFKLTTSEVITTWRCCRGAASPRRLSTIGDEEKCPCTYFDRTDAKILFFSQPPSWPKKIPHQGLRRNNHCSKLLTVGRRGLLLIPCWLIVSFLVWLIGAHPSFISLNFSESSFFLRTLGQYRCPSWQWRPVNVNNLDSNTYSSKWEDVYSLFCWLIM